MPDSGPNPAPHDPSPRLASRGYLALLGSQACGAINDNILKQVLIFMVIAGGLWDQQLGTGGQGIVGLAFTIPFVLFSGYGGFVADRWCKRRVTVIVRSTEIPIALIAMIGFATQQLWIALAAMVLLSTQSAFFGPCKYGMIPDLVVRGQISRANGVINMLTNVSAIAGSVAAGFIADAYYPKPDPQTPDVVLDGMPLIPGIVLLAIAIGGLLAALLIPSLGGGERNLRIHWNPVLPYVETFRAMKGGPLLPVVVAWGWFYLLAGIALLVVPEYHSVLNTDRIIASYLLGGLGLAIGLGSLIAGFLSGKHIDMRLVPVGIVGLAVGFLLLGLFSVSVPVVAVLLVFTGIFGGITQVPIQASIQALAPPAERGRFVAIANAATFGAMAVSAGLFSLIRGLFSDVSHIFLLCAALTIVGVFLIGPWMKKYAEVYRRERGRTHSAAEVAAIDSATPDPPVPPSPPA